MAFKGTEKRSARDIAEEIEQVGGDLNAATSLETTAYYARVLKADVDLGLEIIADILQNPKYAPEDVERERDVILQEIAGTRDSPDDIAYDLLNEVAYPDQALGRPILGSEADRDELYRRRRPHVPAAPIQARRRWSSRPPAMSTTQPSSNRPKRCSAA